jgi:hypothetical protein
MKKMKEEREFQETDRADHSGVFQGSIFRLQGIAFSRVSGVTDKTTFNAKALHCTSIESAK